MPDWRHWSKGETLKTQSSTMCAKIITNSNLFVYNAGGRRTCASHWPCQLPRIQMTVEDKTGSVVNLSFVHQFDILLLLDMVGTLYHNVFVTGKT